MTHLKSIEKRLWNKNYIWTLKIKLHSENIEIFLFALSWKKKKLEKKLKKKLKTYLIQL
jgi:hypothetical protein